LLGGRGRGRGWGMVDYVGNQYDVLNGVQVFGEVVSDVEIGTNVRHKKLALSNAVVNPMKAHIDGFGASLLDGIVGDADGASVVAH
jgi:hypothetical protein